MSKAEIIIACQNLTCKEWAEIQSEVNSFLTKHYEENYEPEFDETETTEMGVLFGGAC